MESRAHSIVIVEDEGLIAVDLQGRLERAGYRVPAVAQTASEALEVIREKCPDLILMDIRLQGETDGIQVAEQVRREFDIPVVYLTAYEDRKILDRASQTQAFGYIKKPIDTACLQGSVEMAISKHRHERSLREQRDWFIASFTALPDAVVVADGSGRICYLNPAAEEFLGCKLSQVLGKPCGEFLRFSYQNGQIVDDLMPVVTLNGAPVALPPNICLEGSGNRSYPVEGNLAPRWKDGRPDGVVISFKDVTLRRFDEEQSRRDNKHAALSRLADGIASHLDMELSVVTDESTRLLNSLPSDSTLRSAVQSIESAALDAFAVTCRLRAFGEEREIKPQVVQVNEVLAHIEKTWCEALPNLKVQPDPAPRPVHADSTELVRALDLLLQHAHQWMEPAGGVLLQAFGAELERLHEWVLVRVSYDARSEDIAALDRAFDPSWDGNWEGLPFAYSIINRMGGLLRARLERKKRIIFEAYLPTVEVVAAGVLMEPQGDPVLLVIEENSKVRRLLHDHFVQHGYDVLVAGNCEEALRLAESHERPIRLALANPAKDDKHREVLAARLMDLKPGICVRLIDGYREAAELGRPSTVRCLTKWELLDWSKQVLGSAGQLAAVSSLCQKSPSAAY